MMEPANSLELFSRHAFRGDFPPKDYDILSEKIVSTTAGLPLAIEVIGSLLLGKGKEEWNELLAKLQKKPEEKVQEKLIISYEALNHEQKQIFLDIACLFNGEDKIYLFYMWDACEFYPQTGINVLVLRSLVKIQDDDKFWMHDQLRDLGREIVRSENFKDPGKRSRLWLFEEALDIVERRLGTKKVEALILKQEPLGGSHLTLTNEEFGQLPKLRFLRVVGAELAGDFKHLLSELRWFKWHYGNFAPTSFNLKNLVVLDLSNTRTKDNWEGWSQMKMSEKLKVLNLSSCGLRRIPDLSTCATLEVLLLTCCRDLVQIDPIGNLINLRELRISGCGITELPDSIGNLEKLEELYASYCKLLEGEIPWSIGRLSSLRILRLEYTKICSLPTSVCRLSRLQTLNLVGCEKLKSLPELPPSLTNLQLTTFPSLSNLVNLKELNFSQSHNLVEIPIPRDIGKLSKLETWTLEDTNINSLPAEIVALSQLKKLVLCKCSFLRFIHGLPSSLFELNLFRCPSLKRLPDLSNLKNLSNLMLDDCFELEGIQGLGKLESLTSLIIICCPNIGKLDGLEHLESLRYLIVIPCKSLERLLDLSNLKSLKELTIIRWDNLTEICGLEELESLEYLQISNCRLFEKSPDLSNLKKLKKFVFW